MITFERIFPKHEKITKMIKKFRRLFQFDIATHHTALSKASAQLSRLKYLIDALFAWFG